LTINPKPLLLNLKPYNPHPTPYTRQTLASESSAAYTQNPLALTPQASALKPYIQHPMDKP